MCFYCRPPSLCRELKNKFKMAKNPHRVPKKMRKSRLPKVISNPVNLPYLPTRKSWFWSWSWTWFAQKIFSSQAVHSSNNPISKTIFSSNKLSLRHWKMQSGKVQTRLDKHRFSRSHPAIKKKNIPTLEFRMITKNFSEESKSHNSKIKLIRRKSQEVGGGFNGGLFIVKIVFVGSLGGVWGGGDRYGIINVWGRGG